jgi:hypothetical protein
VIFGQDLETEPGTGHATVAHHAKHNHCVSAQRIELAGTYQGVASRPKTLKKTARHLSTSGTICHQNSRLRHRPSDLAATQV